MSDPLLEIKNLVTGFETESGLLKAVDGVSFTVPKGTCVGIVGESGCGKSVTAMSIVRLLPQPMGKILDGQILFKGRDLVQAKETDMHGIRGRHIGVIFQEPMTALNPVHSISRQIGESLMLHRGMNTRKPGTQPSSSCSAFVSPPRNSVWTNFLISSPAACASASS